MKELKLLRNAFAWIQQHLMITKVIELIEFRMELFPCCDHELGIDVPMGSPMSTISLSTSRADSAQDGVATPTQLPTVFNKI